MPLYDDSRSAWGAAKPNGTIRTVTWAEKTEIFWHYVDGTPQGLSGKPHADCLRKVKQFQSFHMSSARAWSDIGYNALVCQHGRLIEGRGILTVGAHCPNHNRQGIGVQFMVGGSEKPTAAAYARAVRFLTEATAAAGHTFRVLGHRDGTATACPGSVIYAWLQAGMPSSLTPAPTPTDPPKEATMLTEYLVRGDTGPQVTLLQKILNTVGAKLAVDGSFGPGVETAVKGYQTSRKMTADGKVGPATRDSLNAAWTKYNAPPPVVVTPPPVVAPPPPPPIAPAPPASLADVLAELATIAADVAVIKSNTTPKETP